MWASVILAGKRDSRRHSTTGWGKNVEVEEQLSNVRISIIFDRKIA